MLLDAIVLAGGRSSRLGGEPKQHLVVDGLSLLRRAVDVARAAGAQRIVVVGEPGLAAEFAGAAVEVGGGGAARAGTGAGGGTGVDPGADPGGRVEVVREEPAFGGPAAAIAAGVTALGAPSSGTRRRILVLACDMPGCGEAVSALLRAAREAEASLPAGWGGGADGVTAVDASGRRQHLLALYDAGALSAAVHRMGSRLDGLAVRTLIEPLELREVAIPAGAADDVDTWDDAERLGARPPRADGTARGQESARTGKRADGKARGQERRSPMSSEDEQLRELAAWSARLAAELRLEGFVVDVEALLALAGVAAHSVRRPAAPLTTYVVGYAAGLAAAGGTAAGDELARAIDTATRLAHTAAAERAAADDVPPTTTVELPPTADGPA
ncbi:molybdenum cofactor guanylyltransferase [Herbiconiux sp. YIM B11900]|uniref:molybdenum cofactor guanylyltransferase n=1 Tax=Herbiconiux sp. YIM B11900 TaxID=3404131 RepID=UPI003F853AC4